MGLHIQEIDPEGDTLLTLRQPDAPFAVCEEKTMWPNYLPQYDSLVIEEIRELLGHTTLLDVAPTNGRHGRWHPVQKPATRQQPPETDSEEEEDSEESEEETDDEDEGRIIQMLVSSKHLMYASKYYQTMLAGNWAETKARNGYRYQIATSEWSYDAVLILMNILHGRTRDVPRKLDLETLAQVAALTDYYECSDAVDFFSKTWAENLEDPEPSAYGRKLLLRMSIAWVFGEGEVYHKLAKIVLRSIRGPMHQLDLPGLPQTGGKSRYSQTAFATMADKTQTSSRKEDKSLLATSWISSTTSCSSSSERKIGARIHVRQDLLDTS